MVTDVKEERERIIFRNRREAGRQLAEEMWGRDWSDAIVMAIPRGGVVIGAEIAEQFGLPLDLIIPRKIGLPFNPEVAVGAVGQDGTVYLNEEFIEKLNISRAEWEQIIEKEIREIKRRMFAYRGSDLYPSTYQGKSFIITDDGIATGYTILAAARTIKRMFNPRQLTVAIPVAPAEVLKQIQKELNYVYCLYSPTDFWAVGQFYQDFSPVEDEEVIAILQKLNRKRSE